MHTKTEHKQITHVLVLSVLNSRILVVPKIWQVLTANSYSTFRSVYEQLERSTYQKYGALRLVMNILINLLKGPF